MKPSVAGLPFGIPVAEAAAATAEDAFGGGRGHDLGAAGVLRALGLAFRGQAAFRPGGAAGLQNRQARSTGPVVAAMPWRAKLSNPRRFRCRRRRSGRRRCTPVTRTVGRG
jgi:hypothetical protein